MATLSVDSPSCASNTSRLYWMSTQSIEAMATKIENTVIEKVTWQVQDIMQGGFDQFGAQMADLIERSKNNPVIYAKLHGESMPNASTAPAHLPHPIDTPITTAHAIPPVPPSVRHEDAMEEEPPDINNNPMLAKLKKAPPNTPTTPPGPNESSYADLSFSDSAIDISLEL